MVLYEGLSRSPTCGARLSALPPGFDYQGRNFSVQTSTYRMPNTRQVLGLCVSNGGRVPSRLMAKVSQELPGGWTADFSYEDQELIGLSIRPTSGGKPTARLSSTVLRDLDFAAARREHEGEPDVTEAPMPTVLDGELRAAHADGADSDGYLALLSVAFMAITKTGRKPGVAYERLSEVLGITASTVRNHLWRAKRAGLAVPPHGITKHGYAAIMTWKHNRNRDASSAVQGELS